MLHDNTKLQVLICTFGEEGIRRIAAAGHPQVEGVEYLVSWQLPAGDVAVPPELSDRPDFRIVKSDTRGLARNRNIALREASAPLCLISDDDVLYTREQLRLVIASFEQHPAADLITFKFSSKGDEKRYPAHPFPLSKPPKGYFVSSIEIAFRRDKIAEAGISFNERFGIGGEFMAGEEELFIDDALRHNLRGIFLPEIIAVHNEASTGIRNADNPDFIRTKGAVFLHTHPRSWILRMLTHALRHNSRDLSRFQYIKHWLNGAFTERKLHRTK